MVRSFTTDAIAVALCILSLLALSGCAAVFSGPAPLACEEAWIAVGDRGSLHETAGLYLVVRSESRRTISAIEIAGALYDANGLPLPAAGANEFRSVTRLRLLPGASATLVIALDEMNSAEGRPSRVRPGKVSFVSGPPWRNPGTVDFTDVLLETHR